MRVALSCALLVGAVQAALFSPKGPVQKLDMSNFDKEVMSIEKPTMVAFTAPWCGHCKNLAPTYEKLAESYAANPETAKQVSVVKMDGTANDVPPHAEITLQGFPTLLLKPAGKGERKLIQYEGDRTLESLVEFIASKGTHKASPVPTGSTSASAATESTAAHDEL